MSHFSFLRMTVLSLIGMLLFLLNSLFYVPSVSISIMLNGSRYGSYLRGLLSDPKQGDSEGISTYTSNDNPRTDDNSIHFSWLRLWEQGRDPLLTEGKANEPNPQNSIKSLTILQDTQEGKSSWVAIHSENGARFYTEEPRHTDCCAPSHQPLHFLAQKKPHTTSCRSSSHNTACLTNLFPKAPRATTEKGSHILDLLYMVAHAHNPSTREMRQEDYTFGASWFLQSGFQARTSLRWAYLYMVRPEAKALLCLVQ